MSKSTVPMTFKGCQDAAFNFTSSVVELAKVIHSGVVSARAEGIKGNLDPLNGFVSGFTKNKKGKDFKDAFIAYIRSNTNLKFDTDSNTWAMPAGALKVSPVGRELWYSPEKKIKSAGETTDSTPISDAMFYAGLKTWVVRMGKRNLSASQKVELKSMTDYLSS